jgi:hypothetical protein
MPPAKRPVASSGPDPDLTAPGAVSGPLGGSRCPPAHATRVMAGGEHLMAAELLGVALAAAVPLWIAEVRHLTFEQRAARAKICADVTASRGDVILYRSVRRGATAEAFNALAEGLAIAACHPGGVTAFGQHWCADAV